MAEIYQASEHEDALYEALARRVQKILVAYTPVEWMRPTLGDAIDLVIQSLHVRKKCQTKVRNRIIAAYAAIITKQLSTGNLP